MSRRDEKSSRGEGRDETAAPERDETTAHGRDETAAPGLDEAARKRAALETYSRHRPTLRRTALRYSLCGDDADEALARSFEIVLRKAPSTDTRDLLRWTQTVVKHEALAVRGERERILAGPAANADADAPDWVGLIPSGGDGPAERVERREAVARSREALQALKPQELRALTLLAEGYSYREIGELTGFSATKINRCLAEGRERFRRLLVSNADGSRCTELRPRLSAFCDGELDPEASAELREHLRACAHCRAVLRAYRAAPAAAAALAPTLPFHRSLFERGHDALQGLAARFGGGPGSDTALSQVAAAGGSRGAGMAALAKLMAVCVGGVGGAAACVATGVVPVPAVIEAGAESRPAPVREDRPRAGERRALLAEEAAAPEVTYEPAPEAEVTTPQPQPEPGPKHPDPDPTPNESAAEAAPVEAATSGGAVEYTPPPPAPPPAPEPTPAPTTSSSSSTSGSSAGSAAGEFGP